MKLLEMLKYTAASAVVATFAFGTSSAIAEDAGTNIDVTVQNAITFVETQPIAFGTVVAISDNPDTSTLVIDTAGVATFNNPGNARLTEVVAGQQGIFDVSNAAPNAGLTITLPGSVTLTCSTCSGSQPDFSVTAFNHDAGATPTTDGAGVLSFNVGATLNTQASANPYEDGLYTNTYTVSVNY